MANNENYNAFKYASGIACGAVKGTNSHNYIARSVWFLSIKN